MSYYQIPEMDPASEAARTDYETHQGHIDLVIQDSLPLHRDEFDEEFDEDFESDVYESEHHHDHHKRKKQKHKWKKREKRALDIIQQFDWELHGVPETPSEAKKRRKQFKKKIRGKNSLDWRGFCDFDI